MTYNQLLLTLFIAITLGASTLVQAGDGGHNIIRVPAPVKVSIFPPQASPGEETPPLEEQPACTDGAMVVRNPVAGVDGIYRVATCGTNEFDAYVDMTTTNGPWVMIARWVQVPSDLRLYYRDIATMGSPVTGYTDDPINFPIIPSGLINTSSMVMTKSGNVGWTSRYGQWQQFSTFNSSHVFDRFGFPATTSNGTTVTLFHRFAGWSTNQTVDTAHFSLWTQWGNSGPCGGVGRSGSNKICLSLLRDIAHSDAASLKQVFLKANN